MRNKRVHGFQTGDMVRADVPKGARKGVHIGRVAVAKKGQFTVGGVKDVRWQWCELLQRGDGYGYTSEKPPSAGCALFPRHECRGTSRFLIGVEAFGQWTGYAGSGLMLAS
jgi:hypothetical protein